MGRQVPDPMLCFCGATMALRQGKYGPFYGCTTWPECPGTAALHDDGTLKSLPADQETKASREGAHALFDKLWKEGLMSRSQAYKLLSEHMGLHPKDTHIGYFDQKQCDKVVAFVYRMVAEETGGRE